MIASEPMAKLVWQAMALRPEGFVTESAKRLSDGATVPVVMLDLGRLSNGHDGSIFVTCGSVVWSTTARDRFGGMDLKARFANDNAALRRAGYEVE